MKPIRDIYSMLKLLRRKGMAARRMGPTVALKGAELVRAKPSAVRPTPPPPPPAESRPE
jgi:hypothetical protein